MRGVTTSVASGVVGRIWKTKDCKLDEESEVAEDQLESAGTQDSDLRVVPIDNRCTKPTSSSKGK